jgi:hypothetical protein
MLSTRLEICQGNKLNGLLLFVVSSAGSMWGCSNFVEKTFRDDGLCQYAEPISELYFVGLGDADHHIPGCAELYYCQKRLTIVNFQPTRQKPVCKRRCKIFSSPS